MTGRKEESVTLFIALVYFLHIERQASESVKNKKNRN
jgi:hypothetical protein